MKSDILSPFRVIVPTPNLLSATLLAGFTTISFRNLALLTATLALTQLAWGNTERWQGVSGASATTNWSDNANWLNITAGGNPGYTNNDLLFGNEGAATTDNTINSVADTSDQASSITFTNQSGNFHTILIPAGITLINTNPLTVGSVPSIDANNTKVNFTGGGTLVQKGNVTVRNNANTSGSTSLATLDLSGLSVLICSNSGTVNVGGVAAETRSAGQLVLAGVSNNITTTTLNLQTTTGNGGNNGSANLRLGAGTNVINAGTINLVAGKAVNGTLSFLGGTGGLRIRGANGNADDSSRATISICNRNSTGTGTMTGTADFTGGHPVDIKADTITIGRAGSNPTSAPQNGTGNFRFDAGKVDAITINIATNGVANAATTGNLVVGGALVVSNISLVAQTAAGTATGNLFIGGSVTSGGGINKATLAGIGNITITNGSLTVAPGKTVGDSGTPIDSLTLNNATMTLAAGGASPAAVVTTLNINGTTDTINISSAPGVGQFPVLSYTTLNGAYDFVLGTLAPGFQGYLSNNASGLSVDIVITNTVIKSDTWRGNVNGNWDTSTANWVYSGNPSTYQQGDSVSFDDTLTGTPNVNLTTTLTPSAISCNNSVANYAFSGSGKLSGTTSLIKGGTGSLTLTETGGDDFSGGIAVNGGLLILDNANSAITGGLTIGVGATAQLGNNSANGGLPGGGLTVDGTLIFKRTSDVTVGTPIPGSGALTKSASGKLTLTVPCPYSGNTTVDGGTLALTGAGSITNSAAVAVSSAALDLSAASGPRLLNALNLTNSTTSVAMPNLNPPLTVTSLGMGGAGNTINVSSLPPIATYPSTVTLIQSASAVSGFNMTLGTLPAATPPYAGSVSLSGDQLSVRLTLTSGPVGVRPAVFWSGADVPNLNTNWSDGANWQLPGAPTSADNAIFNNTATASASALTTPGGGAAALDPANFNNIVDANFTISSLTYTNDSDTYHNTFINSGKALAITNALTVGGFDSGAGAQHGFVTVSGANGSLSFNNANGNFQVWIGSGTSGGSQATLDLSALDNLSATVSRCLSGATIGNVVNRPSGIIYLAKTNTITVGFQTTSFETGTATANGAIVVGDCNGNAGSASFAYLGRANTLSADTIGVARQKTTAHLLFNPIYVNTAPYPSVTIQGFSSSRVSIFNVGDGVGNTGTTTPNGDVDFSGGIVNVSVDRMTIGRASSGGTGANIARGSLVFDAGTINVNTLNIGLQSAANAKSGVGTVSVSSNTVIGAAGTLIVGGQLNLGPTVGGDGAATTSGTLNVTNGTVLANAINAGAGSVSTINLAGGRLISSNAIGSAFAPVGTLNLAPLGTPDNSRTDLHLHVGSSPGATVATLNLDGLGTTTNVVHVVSVGPVGATPVELPLIQYGVMNVIGGTFNVGLGSLPSGYTGYLTNDTAQSMIAIVVTSAINPQPVMTSVSVNGTNLVMSGINGFANGPYYVLASTNVASPLSEWIRIATNVFGPTGSFTFSTPIIPVIPSRFYLLQVP